jgi:hypothetical protein
MNMFRFAKKKNPAVDAALVLRSSIVVEGYLNF